MTSLINSTEVNRLSQVTSSKVMEKLSSDDLVRTLADLKDSDLAKLSHALLYSAREKASPEQQNRLAKYEHRAFAREAVEENPLMALPVATSIPLYQAYKVLKGARSDASLSQIGQGLLGVGEGLFKSTFK